MIPPESDGKRSRINLPEYKAKPLKRIYIPKKNGKKRPLGIPAMHDRMEQALELPGLDPVSESLADHHSYGLNDRMWEDDFYWLPQVLRGKQMDGQFIFDDDTMVSLDVAIRDPE